MEYIKSLENKPDASSSGCFLCDAFASETSPAKRAALGVLWTTSLVVVLMNKFPYTSGHLLVAPRQHVSDLEALDEPTLAAIQIETAKSIRLLKHALNPQGFNVGINLGRAAGAGLPGHLHQHIVPRWAGDTNFVSVVGDIRIIPHARETIYTELTNHAKQMGIGS